MILAELLDAGQQLAGDVPTMLSFLYFPSMRCVNKSLWTDPGGVEDLFIT